MLSRIPVHRFAALSRLPCRASVALRPIIDRYFAALSRHRRLLSDSPVATAAAEDRRGWVMLSTTSRRRRPDDPTFLSDADTMAESRTSKGRRVCVSFRCAAPPSSSYLYYHNDCIRVVAAHRELILLETHHYGSSSFVDHFVYRPAGARRPPSLSLLPVFPPDDFDPGVRPRLDSGSIGLLRRDDNDILAVQVRLLDDYHAQSQTVEFCVLCPGMQKWELMEPVPFLHHEDEGDEGLWRKMLGSPDDVICVGDRFICWVNYRCDFLLCDMADKVSPKVRYVPLPPEVRRCSYGNDNPLRVGRTGAAGNNSVRFVSIHPHSCVRDDLYSRDDADCWRVVSDRTTLGHPSFVYTIKTWTMKLNVNEPLEWIEDGEIDSDKILALPGYQGLPQGIPKWPVVCLDRSNVICFLVTNYYFTKDNEKLWMPQLNINTKTLLSVHQFTDKDDGWHWKKYHHLPAEI